MVDRSMQGVYPILSMPFDEQGRIDFEDLEAQTEWMIDCGVDGVGIAMASEVYALTEQERDDALACVVKTTSGRARVVMNTGAEGTEVAIQRSRRAEELGADALMIRPTSYIPTVESEHVDYFTRIAEQVTIPIFLQDYATAPIPPAMAVECARRHENLCYVKVETAPTVPRIAEASRIRGDSGLILFGGAGGAFFLEELRRGSVGTMPGSTLPDMFVRVWRLWCDGKESEAAREFHLHAAIIRSLNQGLGLATWAKKHMMVRRGILKPSSAHVRHPSLRPDDMAITELDQILAELDLITT